MATEYQYGGALSKRRARRGYRVPMSEINVTPMVDVMLVLLIICMVTAPLLTVDADGKIYLQDSEIEFEELVPKLTAISETFGTGQVWVRGDAATSYGDVARVLVRIKEAGLPVTLLTDEIAQP
jgi:biopolymer transport protein TolR